MKTNVAPNIKKFPTDNDGTEIPPLKDFLTFTKREIMEFVQKNSIKTVYLPVDGTRRAFIQHVLQQSHSLPNFSDEKIFLEKYAEYLVPATINLLSTFYEFGIKNLIFLLMDKTAFSRSQVYLEKLVTRGILPFIEDERYLNFYKKYDVKVLFGGFNELYQKYNLHAILDIFEQVEMLTHKNKRHQLVFYTGLYPDEDYILVSQIIERIKKENKTINLQNLIKYIYKTQITPIDFAIFYGFPRDKILPPLLWCNAKRFYSPNPSLTLTKIQIKTAIYYTAMAQHFITDDYINYHSFITMHKSLLKNEYLSQLKDSSLVGTELYDVSTPLKKLG